MTRNTGSDRIAYPALPEPLQAGDLVRLFTPTSVEIDWASSVTRSERTRCHVLTLLKVFQTLGRFISPNGIPGEVVNHVARCAGVPEVQANAIFSSRPTLYRHQHLVLEYMDVSRWNASAQQQVENTIEALASVRTHPADLLNGANESIKTREDLQKMALTDCKAAALLVDERCSAEESRAYKQWTISVARNVAEAAKEGSILGFGGERVSPAERELLTQIEHTLGVASGELYA